MVSTIGRNLNIINRNNVLVQNWRNDAITRYANKGNNLLNVIHYIDGVIIPTYSRFYPDKGFDELGDMSVPRVDRSLLKSMEVMLSVKFPPLIRKR